jgi:imidazolonepropionase
MAITIYKNISELLTLQGAAQKNGRKVQETDLSIVKKAAIAVDKGRIIWVGEQKKIPKAFATKAKEVDLKSATVLPGFVECHTHSIFAGSRSAEFELRNQGVSYQEISARGGGIRSTMKATRAASSRDLKNLLSTRIERFVRQGVTTLEVKTGYALDEKNEIRCLKILNESYPIRVVPTYLGAHAIPPEFNDAQDYLDFSAAQVLPKIRKLTRRVDIFIERGFFNFDPALDYLQKAKDLGFEVVIHADQLSFCGGADAARMMGALSADHLLMVSENTISELAESAVTCVLLPAADLYMKCSYPKARQMIDAGCRVALATDFNPGSSPTQDLALVGLLARLEMKMTLPEVIAAYTIGASYALGLEGKIGSLDVSKDANFICIENSWDQLFYSAGGGLVSRVFCLGNEI